MANITGILLAAGSSTRFGTNKLTAKLAQRALVLHSAEALAPCDRVIAVVREDDEEVQNQLRVAGVEIVINPLAHRGMGSSIARAVSASQLSRGWCILPADMPCVLASTTTLIVNALLADAALVAPYHKNRRGHPVGFSNYFASSLGGLDGDFGARKILEQHSNILMRIDVNDPGVLLDTDTTQDLAILEDERTNITPLI